MRKPNNHFVRKEDLTYTPQVGLSDGYAGGLDAVASDRALAKQLMQAAFDIQAGEDNLRQSIIEQQNKVALLDATNRLSDINKASYESLKLDPDQFRVATNEQASEVINELPMILRGIAKNTFVQEQNDYYYRALNNKREYLDRQTSEQTQVAIKNCADKAVSNIEGMLNPNPGISSNAQIAFGSTLGEFNAFLGAKNSYNLDIFTPEQKDKLNQFFFGTVFQKFAELKMNSIFDVQEKIKFINDVLTGNAKIELEDGTTIANNVLHYEQRQVIARHLADNLKSLMKQQQSTELLAHAQSWLAGDKNVFVPPEVHEKAMGLYYKQAREGWGIKNIMTADQNTRDTITNSLCSFIAKSGVLVDELKEDLESLQNSGIPQAFEVSSNVISFINANRDNLPNVIKNLNTKNFCESIAMSKLVDLRIPSEQAYSMVMAQYRNMTEEQRKTRGKEFSTILHDNETLTDDVILPNQGKNVVRNNEATGYIADYKYLIETSFMSGATIDEAKKFADTFILKKWSKVEKDGKTYLRAYAPELFYSVPGLYGASDIEKSIINKAKSLKIEKPENVIVLADEQTYGEISGKNPEPTYAMWVFENGVPMQIRNKQTGKQERIGGDDFRPPQMVAIQDKVNSHNKQINDLNREIENTFINAEKAIAEYEKSRKASKKNVEWGHYLYKRHEAEKPFIEKRKALKQQKKALEKEKETSVKQYKNRPEALIEDWKKERGLK